ncbi:hypothetical protein DICPUDRAFT_156408 [Dictyostelium purpureum]|uniref:Uncharacterized protein n=1 Tax=Dictyostelium purpureum TaxID=5786 RepID=F0ZWH7_DICPU|nr:uncharacterized protein DICPUDRAFT_156408 [Dictyostelium purpureum]EGC31701.1 hypothetical protein DICPUDRAFT_156408 [Dictyostelium purpureum]|eukprot:XP_003291767.1 hypothetical protein DICPUDRAFT_156408 [Dictyostelium purpureum]
MNNHNKNILFKSVSLSAAANQNVQTGILSSREVPQSELVNSNLNDLQKLIINLRNKEKAITSKGCIQRALETFNNLPLDQKFGTGSLELNSFRSQIKTADKKIKCLQANTPIGPTSTKAKEIRQEIRDTRSATISNHERPDFYLSLHSEATGIALSNPSNPRVSTRTKVNLTHSELSDANEICEEIINKLVSTNTPLLDAISRAIYSVATAVINIKCADESIEHLVGGCTGMNKHGRIRRHDAAVTKINVCVPFDGNIEFKQAEKLNKYHYLQSYFQNQYKYKDSEIGHNKSYNVELVPIVVGAFGRIITEEVSYTLNPNTRDATSIPIMKFFFSKDCINTLPLPVAEKKFLKVKIP